LEEPDALKLKTGSDSIRVGRMGRSGLRIDAENARIGRGYNLPVGN
jgi:hypothetical protein